MKISKVTEQEKQEVINLYEKGLNCVQIKDKMGFKGHQKVLNILNKYSGYIPYKYGRNPIRKYTLKEDYFETINTEEKAYILGFLAADGHIGEINNRVRILVATKDKDILEKIRLCLNSNTNIIDFIKETRFDYGAPLFYHSKVEFNSAKMVKILVKLGLNHRKTYSLDSSIINKIPEDLIRHFLRGYFDGDGNVMWGRKYSSGIKYNINIAGNLEFLNGTFNKYFPTKNKFYKDLKSKQCWMYKLSSKENVLNFLKYLYHDSKIFLNRKHKVYLEACGHLKQGELLETPTLERQKEDNQQPSLSSNTFDGSTTNSQILTVKTEDSNANTSALPSKTWISYDNFKFYQDYYRSLGG